MMDNNFTWAILITTELAGHEAQSPGAGPLTYPWPLLLAPCVRVPISRPQEVWRPTAKSALPQPLAPANQRVYL